MLTIGNKAEEIWGQWVGIQKITTVDHLAKAQYPRWVYSVPACKEAEKDAGMAHFLPKLFPSLLWIWLFLCVDHHQVSTATELPFGRTRKLKFVNSFYYPILLFCGAQLQILYSRPHKVSFLSALLCLRRACSLLLERRNVKMHVWLFQSVFTQK